jgi:hypothetical protein
MSVTVLAFELWKERFIGAYAVLCGDIEEAEEVGNDWKPEEVDVENDCPIESARTTYEEAEEEDQLVG